MKLRQGNNPKRRVTEDVRSLDSAWLQALSGRVRYVGSGHHKRYPADYGFERTNPVPTKSLCDAVAPVSLAQAAGWLLNGIRLGMISTPAQDGFPKYVWCIAEDGRVFESKTHPNTPGLYHGYPLEEEDDLCAYLRAMWGEKCRTTGQ